MTCERCGHRAIVLWRTWDERGVCTACLFEGRGIAESVALSARLDRLFARTPSADAERHAGHVWAVPDCADCERARP